MSSWTLCDIGPSSSCCQSYWLAGPPQQNISFNPPVHTISHSDNLNTKKLSTNLVVNWALKHPIERINNLFHFTDKPYQE